MPKVGLDGGELFFESYGEGPPIILFSQTGSSGQYWTLEQVPYLAPSYQVIVHDYRGTGRSTRFGGHYATRQFAHDAHQILSELGITEPVHLLGHSMGGRVAQWFTLDFPQQTRSLVLYASGSGPDEHPEHETIRNVSPELLAKIVALGWPNYHDDEVRGSDAFVQGDPEMRNRYAAAFSGEFGTDCASFIRHLIARAEHETTGRLNEITVPTLVLIGDKDQKVSSRGIGSHLESAMFLAASIPHAELVVLPGGAHAMHIELADQFNATLGDFFAQR